MTKPKSAEEWAVFFHSKSMHFCLSSREGVVLDAIRSIQLDAMRAGMRMAAKEAATHPVGVSAKDWSDYCRGRNDAAKAILTVADNLKESDL